MRERSKTILYGIALASPCTCSSVAKLSNILSSQISNLNYDKGKIISSLLKFREKNCTDKGKTLNQREALNLLISQDIERIIDTLNKSYFCQPEKSLPEAFEKLIKKLDYLGINLGEIVFKIVNEYPSPYSEMLFSAMAYDVYDEKEFGIPRGVYFKKNKLTPIYCICLLAHELIHLVFGKKYFSYLARGLEDGIADLIGTYYLCSDILSPEICKNVLINSRLSYPSTQFWTIYTEGLRQAMTLYKYYGIKGLLSLLKQADTKGRKVVKDVEKLCLEGKYEMIDFLDKGDWEQNLDSFVNEFVGYPQSIAISPLAYILAERISVGDDINHVLKKENIDPSPGREAIEELQDRVYLILYKDTKIISDETKPYLSTHTIRYIPDLKQ